eukprot:TRINITY_DN2590_c0_g2_i1.p2 TRINITY_DN2590_c0_g2~~TRINITY_DN2590_c0_g2_i1.p2  ORF type:complete len:103 (+),score=14.92 TRINITY_DN2590_c0_g2_i1:51-359(+)
MPSNAVRAVTRLLFVDEEESCGVGWVTVAELAEGADEGDDPPTPKSAASAVRTALAVSAFEDVRVAEDDVVVLDGFATCVPDIVVLDGSATCVPDTDCRLVP